MVCHLFYPNTRTLLVLPLPLSLYYPLLSSLPLEPARPYVENKAGLTGQTVPGRRIPGHWPYPGPEELAEAELVGPDVDVPFF